MVSRAVADQRHTQDAEGDTNRINKVYFLSQQTYTQPDKNKVYEHSRHKVAGTQTPTISVYQ